MNNALREGELQLLVAPEQVAMNDLSSDRASFENEKNRFALLPTDMTGVVNKLSDKRLITHYDH